MRQIILDTETTGLEVSLDHRIIEIGCIEMRHRRLTGKHWHHYFNPERPVDPGAFEVHGLGDEFLADKPCFAELADDFLAFIDGAELVIHNAPFDLGFLNYELQRLDPPRPPLESAAEVLDTLTLARQKYPGQKNNLDALCRRFEIDNRHRSLHGALLDARLLGDVYLLMTGGQTSLGLEAEEAASSQREEHLELRPQGGLPRYSPDAEALAANREFADFLATRHSDPAWQADEC